MPILHVAAFGNELWGRLRNEARRFTRDKINEIVAPHSVCSSDRIRSELGWSPKLAWAEGAKQTAKWYREQGWLKK